MANSTATPAAPAKLKSDWYTFLRSAFIDGLRAYGAALMVAAPEPTLTLSKIPSHLGTGESSRLTPMGAPCLPVLETWETSRSSTVHTPRVAVSQPSPALPRTPLPKPAWTRA